MENYNVNRQENLSNSRNWNETVQREDRFRHMQEVNNPSRYNRNEPYFGNLSDYERRAENRFPESGVNRDTRGLHSGKGPKSYKRSDERVKEIVCEKLSDDPFVDASDIEISVNNCEVTLTGSVHDRSAKRRAEDIVENIPGITHVENRIRVGQREVQQ
jgi:hypothetical protein